MGWQRERVWVDPFKIGKAAVFQKVAQKLTRKKKDKKEEEDDEDEFEEASSEDFKRKWLQHMVLAEDGFSDPPGIRVRPVTGLHGCDYLSDQPLVKAKSYVMGFLINALCDIGYESKNLEAMSYDWRLPPSKLNERDGYFIKLKHQVEVMYEINNERVVLMGHSLGTRCTQYFLEWARNNLGQDWLNKYVHAFLAMGPPFLGAPKSVRAVISGDTMDLEVFLTEEEGKSMCRRSASLPWLFPLQQEKLPDCVGRVKGIDKEMDTGFGSRSLKEEGNKKKEHKEYIECNVERIVNRFAPKSWSYFQTFYEKDPLYITPDAAIDVAPVIGPPPVQNLWVVCGVNLNTEVSYYYKTQKHNDKETAVLDPAADRYSGKKLALINPRGLLVTGGIAYETNKTYQPTIRMTKSGDGTVPYASMNHAAQWKNMIGQPNVPLQSVHLIEIEGAEHRAMLTHEGIFDAILTLLCEQQLA